MGSRDTIIVDIGTWNQYNIEYSQNDIKVVGDYNLENGEVDKVGQTDFKGYRQWDHQEVNLLQGWDGGRFVDTFAEQANHDHSDLHHLLQWVMMNSYDLAGNKIDFVCKRGILRKIGDTFHSPSPWTFEVCCLKGSIYLSKKCIPINKPDLNESKSYYFGTAFEKLVTTGEDVDSYIVTECKLKDVKCLIAGEIDCKAKDEYIEIKTALESKLSKRMRRGWLHAYLIGNHKLVYGLRDNNFNLVRIIEEQTESVPGTYQEEGNWNGQQILGFIYSVLQRIKNEVPEGRIYTLKYDGERDTKYHLIPDSDSGTFLSDEFKRYVSSRNNL